MAIIATKNELNACYTAMKKLDEAEALLVRAAAVLSDLDCSRVNDGFYELSVRRDTMHTAMREYLGQRYNVPRVESLSEVLERVRPEPEPEADPYLAPECRPGYVPPKPYRPPAEAGSIVANRSTVGDVSVEFISYGDRKINSIRVVRNHVGHLGLKEAKEFVEATNFHGPSIVRGLVLADAEQFVADLRECGATAAIVAA